MLSRLFSRGAAKFRVRVAPIDADFEAGRDGTVLEAALEQGVAFPHDCRVGTCGTCRCKLEQGQVRELIDKAYVLSAEEIRENYILACQSVARSDLVVTLPAATANASPRHTLVDTASEIAAIRPRTHDIIELELALEKPMAYTAGQYADLFVPGAGSESRSYSFASAPGDAPDDRVRFHVRHVPGGLFSGWLFGSAAVGDRLRVRGPYGSFWLRPGKSPILAIAGGSGMAPIKALLERAARDGVERDVSYFFGVRRREDLYGVEEMSEIAAGWKGKFEFVPVLSEEPAGTDWTGERGLVTDAAARRLDRRIGKHHLYFCGPPAMVDAAVALGKAHRVADENVHFDKFLDRSHQPAAGAETRV
jgi:NAD(P)H-flavin reductase/ferredoxin